MLIGRLKPQHSRKQQNACIGQSLENSLHFQPSSVRVSRPTCAKVKNYLDNVSAFKTYFTTLLESLVPDHEPLGTIANLPLIAS